MVPLRSNIDVSAAREVTLAVRISEINLAGGSGTGPSLSFFLQACAPQGDGKVWTLNSAVATATVASQAAISNGLYEGSNSAAVGGLVNLIASFTQYSGVPSSADFVVSADLIQKA